MNEGAAVNEGTAVNELFVVQLPPAEGRAGARGQGPTAADSGPRAPTQQATSK